MAEASRPRAFWRKYLVLPLEAVLLHLAYYLFAALSFDFASAIGGWIARTIGPHLKVTKTAVRNLKRAFPEKSDDEIAHIVRGVWDNLGRVATEFPQSGRLRIHEDARFTVAGVEHIDRLRDDGRPGIFFTGHLGNWELAALAIAQRGVRLGVVYRAANHPAAERLVRRGRREIGGELIAKGGAGARHMIKLLSRGGHLGMAVDQKLNDGIPVPFFGREAMTAPALAELALKFRCPVVPMRVERVQDTRFLITAYPPLDMPDSGDRRADVKAGMALVNRTIEGWVRERPEQWLWLHRRWPD